MLRETSPLGRFRIVGESALSASPMEVTAQTAREARAQFLSVQRLCGRFGKVVVYGDNGRTVTLDRLNTLATAEDGAQADATVPKGALGEAG